MAFQNPFEEDPFDKISFLFLNLKIVRICKGKKPDYKNYPIL